MQAIMMSETGGPEVLHLRELATPQPGAGEVLIRVEAAGVNFGETMQRAGTYPLPLTLPVTPGSEVAGTVEAVGPGVDGLKLGDRVAALVVAPDGSWAPGGYASHAVAPVERTFRLPKEVKAADAVAVFGQGLTAWFMLSDAAPVQGGRSVLIHAAAGGVGSLAVQLARTVGAGRVLGAVGSPSKHERVLRLGADAVIDSRDPDWPAAVRGATDGRGVDVILDPIGGENSRRGLQCLAPGGRLLAFGFLSGAPPAIGPEAWSGLIFQNQSVGGFANMAYLADADRTRAAVTKLLDLIASGGLVVGRTEFPLSEAAAAHRAMEARQTTGKVVLIP